MTQTKQKWDKKAIKYPRYTEDPNTFEAATLRVVDSFGVKFDGLNVLDVGCGSGRYTLHIAKKAKSVTATDFSSEMLRILEEDAEKEGITNITTILGPWADVDTTGKEFDIVFCSTTPAVRSTEEYRRIYNIASKYVVYVGWAGRKDSEILNPIYEKYGVPIEKLNGSKYVKEWLESQNISYKSQILDDIWLRTLSYDEMKEFCVEGLNYNNIYDYKEADIEEVLNKYVNPDGTVTEKVYARLELTIWEK